MKSARKPTIYQQIIHNLILEGAKAPTFWGKETKICKQLIKKYSQEFMEWLKPPFGYKISSLLYFLSKDGADYLRGQYFEFLKGKMNLSPEIPKVLDNGPILGDNIEIEKRPKSLQEFLKI